jgi:hypothetical protein
MSTIATLTSSETGADSLTDINANFANLNTDKVESRLVNYFGEKGTTTAGTNLAFGNGQNGKVLCAYAGTLDSLHVYSTVVQTTMTLELYIDGAGTGQTVTATNSTSAYVTGLNYAVPAGSVLSFVVTAITTSAYSSGGCSINV